MSTPQISEKDKKSGAAYLRLYLRLFYAVHVTEGELVNPHVVMRATGPGPQILDDRGVVCRLKIRERGRAKDLVTEKACGSRYKRERLPLF